MDYRKNKTAKMIKRSEHHSYEEKLREPRLFTPEKAQGGSH